MSIEQVFALLASTIFEMGRTLGDAMKSNLKSAKDNNDFFGCEGGGSLSQGQS